MNPNAEWVIDHEQEISSQESIPLEEAVRQIKAGTDPLTQELEYLCIVIRNFIEGEISTSPEKSYHSNLIITSSENRLRGVTGIYIRRTKETILPVCK